MTDPNLPPISVEIAADLDAATAAAAHATLLSACERAESEGLRVEIRLGRERDVCAPLALQLLASAATSFPPGTLSFDPVAEAALSTLHQPKEPADV